MKVIKNNTNNKLVEPPKVLKIQCEHCGSELEITEEDAYIGAFGCQYIICPCCENEHLVYQMDGIRLTLDNIEFPTHFQRTSSEHGDAKAVDTDSIKKEIRRGVEYLRQNKDEYDWYVEYGDLLLIVRKFPDDTEYEAVVTKDHYNTYIPFDKEDF